MESNSTDNERHSELIRFLTENSSMRKTAANSIKHSLYAGGGAFAGAWLLGPVGGLVGGVIGSGIGYLQSDTYDGAVLAVLKLEQTKRNSLLQDVGKVLVTAGATVQSLRSASAFSEALHQFAEQDSVRNGIWKACVDSIR
mmetsp:Transcript_31435/g.31691  ORF Transcript_31435/g.31691 Transcript_31435/m.31691 type:complete len:141 (-) Transcript_31435:404-826(-)